MEESSLKTTAKAGSDRRTDPADRRDNVRARISSPISGKRIAFVGKLGGMNRRDAIQMIRRHGARYVSVSARPIDFVVVGADELPLAHDDLLGRLDLQEEQSKVRVISETQLWQKLGLVEVEKNIRSLYTPAMLAGLLGVPVARVRQWHRRGLIEPVRQVHNLPYFDFQEIAVAQQLSRLVSAGASPASIEKKIARLGKWLPNPKRPLAQLGVLVQGRKILLKRDGALIEPGGQKRLDFDLTAEPDVIPSGRPFSVIMRPNPPPLEGLVTPSDYLQLANELEEENEIACAIEVYRAMQLALGPTAEICFRLGELLYLTGQTQAARERYYTTIELDESYVEARAALGCVLVELNQLDLAIAAFRGALDYHEDYPDVQFHLAAALESAGRASEAIEHWQRFLELSPKSPWAEEARRRLERSGAE